jgi:bifunctional non-homologous end joining protein LigD
MSKADGPNVFQHACRMGHEGIVSKRKDSFYVSGRSLYLIKSKNPNAPAVKREPDDFGLKEEAPVARRNRGWVNAAGPSLPKMLLSTKG